MITIALGVVLVSIVYMNIDFFIKLFMSLFIAYFVFTFLFICYWLFYAIWIDLDIKQSLFNVKNKINYLKDKIFKRNIPKET